MAFALPTCVLCVLILVWFLPPSLSYANFTRDFIEPRSPIRVASGEEGEWFLLGLTKEWEEFDAEVQMNLEKNWKPRYYLIVYQPPTPLFPFYIVPLDLPPIAEPYPHSPL